MRAPARRPASTGRVTVPVEAGLGAPQREIIEGWGADAVRNSDGTRLPEDVADLGLTVYETYFPARGDQEWAQAHPEHRTRIYLCSERVTAPARGGLRIQVMEGFFADQIEPDTWCDTARWWQVMDRTTGEEVPADRWRIEGEGRDAVVVVPDAAPHHVHTMAFLAFQAWDSTQMYNYLTNGWEDDPERVKEIPYDVRHPETWDHMRGSLRAWLAAHPGVDVVRFTTFFYHFTLVFDDQAREKYVDWFGYSTTVSPEAMAEFEDRTGLRLRPEDFVDEGYHNSTFRPPSPTYRRWLAEQHDFVTSRVAELVQIVHDAGKQALMFLGDNWIGTEPYGPLWPRTGIDGVVGSVGSAATCRMIAEIPHVRFTEGRFLPYFFPDVFGEGGDPLREAEDCWVTARRALVRAPLDRIGYGGYLSLVLDYPEVVDRIAQVAEEFRELHDRTGGARAATGPITVGVLNAWGAIRSWQTHMVAHAVPFRQSEPYLGVLEILAGLPLDVRFLSFDDVRGGGADEVDVLLSVGSAGTAWSGGPEWADPVLQTAIRAFVATGGGFVGVGEPTAYPHQGAVLQLRDLLGVELEHGWSLSTDRYPPEPHVEHFVTQDLVAPPEVGPLAPEAVVVARDVQVLAAEDGVVRLAVRDAGAGRAGYLAGCPAGVDNVRLLHRLLVWAGGAEDRWTAAGAAEDPRVEVACYPEQGLLLALNGSREAVTTAVHGPDGAHHLVTIPPLGSRWTVTIS